MSAIYSLLTAQQLALLGPLCRRSPTPVQALADAIYADRADGGPDNADHVVRIQIQRMRERLEPHGIRILTFVGQGYMFDPQHVPKLNALMSPAEHAHA